MRALSIPSVASHDDRDDEIHVQSHVQAPLQRFSQTAPQPAAHTATQEPVSGTLPTSNALDTASIFRAHGPYVYTVLRSLGVFASDVDDAFQEVFVVVDRKLSSYEDRGTLRAWVYGICVRVALRFRSRRSAAREIASDDVPEAIDPRTPAEDLSERQARQVLNAILDELDDDKRAVFVLFELEELSMQEVAQSLECPIQTAYSRLRAAREAVDAAVRRYQMRKEFK